MILLNWQWRSGNAGLLLSAAEARPQKERGLNIGPAEPPSETGVACTSGRSRIITGYRQGRDNRHLTYAGGCRLAGSDDQSQTQAAKG